MRSMLSARRWFGFWWWRMDGLSRKTNSCPRHPWSVALPYIPSTQNCKRSTHLSRWKHFLCLSKVRCLHRARIPKVLPSMRAIPRLVKTGRWWGDFYKVEWLWGRWLTISLRHIIMMYATSTPIQPPIVLPNTSSNSAMPSPVIYWVASMAAAITKGISNTHFFWNHVYSPVPSGINSQMLLMTPTLTDCSFKNFPALENRTKFVLASPDSRNISVS